VFGLEKLFRKPETKSAPSLFDAANWAFLIDAGTQTASQIAVTPLTAMRCVPVLAGCRIRCESLGSLPIHLYQRDANGDKEKAVDHPLYKLLHDRPNGWTSAVDFIEQIEEDSIAFGSGYAFANRSGDGDIAELIRLNPTAVAVEYDMVTMEPRYRVTLAGKGQRVFAWQDILHVRSFGGFSALRQAAEAIGLCMAMEKHAGNLFGNGARPSGILTAPKSVSPEDFERLAASWKNINHKDGTNAGGTAVLEDGLSFVPLTFNSVDLQFQELRMFQVLEIARALGVPPSMLFDFSRATWANAEEMAQAFVTFTLLPRTKMWEGAIARLLSAEEQASYYAEFNVDALVRADIAQRFAAYAQAIAARILNPNEARARENMAPYVGGEVYANPNIESAAPALPAPRPKPRVVA
jgi:HK97 family phage portal protein